MIGDLTSDDQRLPVPVSREVADEKIERLLELADEIQSIYMGSYVTIHLHIDPLDLNVTAGKNISDCPRLYSIKLSPKEAA